MTWLYVFGDLPWAAAARVCRCQEMEEARRRISVYTPTDELCACLMEVALLLMVPQYPY